MAPTRENGACFTMCLEFNPAGVKLSCSWNSLASEMCFSKDTHSGWARSSSRRLSCLSPKREASSLLNLLTFSLSHFLFLANSFANWNNFFSGFPSTSSCFEKFTECSTFFLHYKSLIICILTHGPFKKYVSLAQNCPYLPIWKTDLIQDVVFVQFPCFNVYVLDHRLL